MRDIITISNHVKTFRSKAAKTDEEITKTTHEHTAELVKELEKFTEHFTGIRKKKCILIPY